MRLRRSRRGKGFRREEDEHQIAGHPRRMGSRSRWWNRGPRARLALRAGLDVHQRGGPESNGSRVDRWLSRGEAGRFLLTGDEIRQARLVRGVGKLATRRALRTTLHHLNRVERGQAEFTPAQAEAFARMCRAVKVKTGGGV